MVRRAEAQDLYSTGQYHRAVRRLVFDGGPSPALHIPGWPRQVRVVLACGHELLISAVNYRDDAEMARAYGRTPRYCAACAYDAAGAW